ncbi:MULTISPECIES: flavodoxin [Parabacteroides]|uniref:flavodoxin n=1 Tax=Parabacteroides leei TaxID=2939491 RepID=UPI00189BA1C9|nr:flavodoxin [Parabacteroides goldsteinii]
MKNLFLAVIMILVVSPLSACYGNDDLEQAQETPEVTDRKILIAYFSWGGTTQQVAENIAKETGGTLFRIETVNPYPTEYTPCTEVAKVERDNGVRPELKVIVENMEQYDTIFIGCPVWWHTAPMAVWSFLESDNYNFRGKTIIPFCTYAATYRDETLAKIVELTPDSEHLEGFGTTNKNADVTGWLKKIGIIN